MMHTPSITAAPMIAAATFRCSRISYVKFPGVQWSKIMYPAIAARTPMHANSNKLRMACHNDWACQVDATGGAAFTTCAGSETAPNNMLPMKK